METIKISGDTPFFWQWDIDRRVELSGVDGGYVVHFVQEGGEAGCLTVEPYEEEGRWFAAVPNILLQTAAPITAYLYRTAVAGRTACRTVLHVEPRERPEDYVYTETAVRTWETLTQAVAALSASLPAPAYVRDEGERAATVVLGHQGPDTFSLAFLADMHCGFTYKVNDAWAVDDTAVVEAGQGLAVLTEAAPVDAVVLGGDLAVGSYKTDRADGLVRLDDGTRYMHEGAAHAPTFYLRGNHDDAPCMATGERLTARDLYGRLGRKNLLAGAVMGEGCYGYRDFEAQKMRVILLDTDDTAGWNSVQTGAGESCAYLDVANVSASQLKFLAERALDLSDKAAPGEWGIVVCSHRPLDEADTTYTDPVTGTVYSGSVANVQWLLMDYLYKNANVYTHNGETVEYDFSSLTETATVYCCIHGHNHAYRYSLLGGVIPSIGCPNVMNGRERVSADGNTYIKTAGTGQSTAFCVITVDRGQNRLYADHFGAGIDREWEFVPPTTESGYVNRLPLAEDADGAVYNGTGYKVGYRLNSSGVETADASFTLTGYIPVSEGDVVYLQNVTYNSAASNAGNQRMAFYDADKALVGTVCNAAATAIMSRVFDENDNLIQFTVKSGTGSDITGVAYFRMNGTYIGEDSIITVNQPIL